MRESILFLPSFDIFAFEIASQITCPRRNLRQIINKPQRLNTYQLATPNNYVD